MKPEKRITYLLMCSTLLLVVISQARDAIADGSAFALVLALVAAFLVGVILPAAIFRPTNPLNSPQSRQ